MSFSQINSIPYHPCETQAVGDAKLTDDVIRIIFNSHNLVAATLYGAVVNLKFSQGLSNQYMSPEDIAQFAKDIPEKFAGTITDPKFTAELIRYSLDLPYNLPISIVETLHPISSGKKK